jgi:spermidine/putrescine transport system ATP-binding protein
MPNHRQFAPGQTTGVVLTLPNVRVHTFLKNRDCVMQSGQGVVELRNVSKRFGETHAVDDNNLVVRQGEFLSILGPSGCGKTTSLRMIAGFEQPTVGDVFIKGENVTGIPAYKRPVNMVFQHYALFPHMTVADNITYGLRQRRPRPSASELARAADEALARVRLNGMGNRRTYELSGGQQQRVALARALINQPAVLLLDEPLAALDRKLRGEMQFELQSLQRDVGITFLLVTHDQEEALSMSDRVCLMREGRIEQIGSPLDLYDRPSNRYVADFVGKSNFFEGPRPGTVTSVRPEMVELASMRDGMSEGLDTTTEARVINRIFIGDVTQYRLANDRLGEFLAVRPRRNDARSATFEIGDSVLAGWRSGAAQVLTDT